VDGAADLEGETASSRFPRDRHCVDFRGQTRGESHEGVGRLLDIPQGSLVEPLPNRKYGMTRRLLNAFNRLVRVVTRKQPETAAYIEIIDPGAQQQV